ncbi:uncharacterized protein LOC108740082 isoform X2 [Agrilus planipennis]|nr:uncharacterized protein LOC108740082 isoform X2 [Agrilus planipennis]
MPTFSRKIHTTWLSVFTGIILFFATLVFYITVHLVVTVVIFVKYRKVPGETGTLFSEMKQGLSHSFFLYRTIGYDLVDEVQKQYKCCGVIGSNEYQEVPNSCCEGKGSCSHSDAFKKGCLEVMFKEQQTYGYLFGLIHVILLLCEITAAVLSFYLIL